MGRAINICKKPYLSTVFASEFDSDVVSIMANENTSEEVAIPNSNDSPRIANRWSKSKLVQVFWAEISQVGLIKDLPFSLL
jgi:hypothetical protein